MINAAGSGSLTLFIRAVLTYRRAASLPPGAHSAHGRSIGRRFGLIVPAEFIGLYNRTSTALCLIALATVVLALLTGQPAPWTMLPSLGAALTLYLICALLLRGTTTGTHRGQALATTPAPT